MPTPSSHLLTAYRARLWLALFVAPGDSLVGQLVSRLGPSELARRWLAGTPHAGGPRARQITRTLAARYPHLPEPTRIGQAERELERRGLRVVVPGQPLWPAQLDDLAASAPLIVCARGDLRIVAPGRPQVAIVGTRRPSSVGVHAAASISRSQIRSGRTVISGAARGIDATAHAVALDCGVPTVAVVAQSPDWPYPPEHRGLFRDIASTGLVLSEVLPGVRHGPAGFLARNRLIAALAQLTIVVEAPWRSGAVNTAAHAAKLDRELIALSYPIARAENTGAQRIAEEWAGLILEWPE